MLSIDHLKIALSLGGTIGIANATRPKEVAIPNLVGKILHYKSKATGKEYISMISDVSLSDNRVRLGWSDSLENLFNDYELWNGEKWIPFGVLEK